MVVYDEEAWYLIWSMASAEIDSCFFFSLSPRSHASRRERPWNEDEICLVSIHDILVK